MREALIADLVGDVLGPRGGIDEVLTETPLNEYITGVLSPLAVAAPPDIDAAATLPTDENVQETEETERTADDLDIAPFAPVLDPQRRPSSMGISFVLACAEREPAFDLCVTWARYKRSDDGHSPRWTREARSAVLAGIPALEGKRWLDSSGRIVQPGDSHAEVSVHVLARDLGGRRRLVTLHLVNRIALAQDAWPDAETHVYQPQLRVRCCESTEVVPGIEATAGEDEDQVLRFLYRERPVLARGHFTAAVWSAIDVERAHEGCELDIPEAAQRAPFRWVDGGLLGDVDRHRFTAPDVRTEFVPLVPLPSPALGLRLPYCDGTELNAERLSELSSDELYNALSPLARGYRSWIGEQRETGESLPPNDRIIAERLLTNSDAAASRMERGLELLHRSEDIRLAFCFAMRAMALQHSWSRPGTQLAWYPFQLAFVLTALDSIVDPESPDRDVCDLLWVPTGGGKTEAYLALIAFAIAYRRRQGLTRLRGVANADHTGAGVAVISRYTLRLLTIQQFRRTLRLITACELLRVQGLGSGPVGWRPRDCRSTEDFLWGSARFSAGLWVGSGVAPNRLQDTWAGNRTIHGALEILRGASADSEPAQMLRCPACNGVLAVPGDVGERVPAAGYVISWIVRGDPPGAHVLRGISRGDVTVAEAQYSRLSSPGYGTLAIRLRAQNSTAPVMVTSENVDQLWGEAQGRLGRGVQLVCARASRPGYFLRYYSGSTRPYDFDVACPAPDCVLHQPWCEAAPAGYISDAPAEAAAPHGGVAGIPRISDGQRLAHVQEAFRTHSAYEADRVPIPAYTVDDQVYQRCPTVVIATVDKFARPAFEPRAAALFGNVDRHHCVYGYYREGMHCGPNRGDPHPSPAGRGSRQTWVPAVPFDPPALILQDELHLIEGPLGSLVGLYEAAVEALCRDAGRRPIKYIASTATVRQAEEQIQAVFGRRLMTFPPPGLTAADSFFVRFPDVHPLNDRSPGRLYLGICAPGRGPLTPLVRLWARALQSAHTHSGHSRVDPFWTLTGYFNAIRELAGARALYRQDIPERLDLLARRDLVAGIGPRALPEDSAKELSGRMQSTELPVVLDLLDEVHGLDALFTTSMFGTGVDVRRLGLMVVNGQPKTTSSYIQATGRVGRSTGALVATFLRATRPRDLNHYEFFCGYHAQLHRFVEPITVMPFAPGAVQRAIGPVAVLLLRNERGTTLDWTADAAARQMARHRATDPDVAGIPDLLERRATAQPASRRPPAGAVLLQSQSALDDWQAVANRNRHTLEYCEYGDSPTSPVVLGDAQHQHAGLEVAYENAPQSLRDIEETCGFQTR